jgi:hypothetical protein
MCKSKIERKSVTNKNVNENTTKLPIIWAIIHKKDKKKPVCIGVCGYCWKPFFAGSILHVIAVHDFYLNQSAGECEEGTRCLNLSCKFNKTTLQTFAKSWYVTSTENLIAKIKPIWEKVIHDVATYQSFADECKKVYDKDPNGRVLEFGEDKGNG